MSFPQSLNLRSLTVVLPTVAVVDREHLVIADPEFDDPNIDPNALPLGKSSSL